MKIVENHDGDPEEGETMPVSKFYEPAYGGMLAIGKGDAKRSQK